MFEISIGWEHGTGGQSIGHGVLKKVAHSESPFFFVFIYFDRVDRCQRLVTLQTASPAVNVHVSTPRPTVIVLGAYLQCHSPELAPQRELTPCFSSISTEPTSM